MKAEIFRIFNEIQTGSNTIDNLDELFKHFEKKETKKFNETFESVILIIFKNYDKNNVALKNIKEFLLNFLDRITKVHKLNNKTSELLAHMCSLLCLTTKKVKHKILCLYFLSNFTYNNRHLP